MLCCFCGNEVGSWFLLVLVCLDFRCLICVWLLVFGLALFDLLMLRYVCGVGFSINLLCVDCGLSGLLVGVFTFVGLAWFFSLCWAHV